MENNGRNLERERFATLIGGTLVALASGTNYVYSAYAPQLASKLRITHTTLNVVGLAGNVGVYFSGPIWGRLVDRRGPRILFAGAFVMLLAGYSGIRMFYNSGDSVTRLSFLPLAILVFCSFLTGMGGNGGLTASMNANAKSWPDKRRATTNGIVISGFGLSAFFFSTIARTFFKGDTSSLLLLLSLGTSIPMIMGFFVVKPIPHAELPGEANGEAAYQALPTEVDGPSNRRDNSRTRLLNNNERPDRNSLDEDPRASVELSPNRRTFTRTDSMMLLADLDVHGKALFKAFDFWLLVSIMFLLSGTGLMYINNVGSMTQALLALQNPKFDPVEGLKRQATQVSVISVCNFSGRIIIGILADFCKHRFGFPRSFGISLFATGFVISQVIASRVEDIDHLWIASAVLGLAYGMLFGLFPTIVIEWFGLSHFSENWGFVSVAPAFGGNLFSLAFGRNLDAHDPTLGHVGVRQLADDDDEIIHRCLKGRLCYVDTLYLATFGCSLALMLAIYAGMRDWRRRKQAGNS